MMRLLRRWQRFKNSVSHALSLARDQRLGACYQAPHQVVSDQHTYTYALRRYINTSTAQPNTGAPPLLIVPPLMVTADIYDISPELSAATFLLNHNLDVWILDFGAPEEIDGGMERTLDDHILAVVSALERVYQLTSRKVHVAGYSQGGLFAYQAVAYLRGQYVASIITFGSPVDLRKSVSIPLHDALAERLMSLLGHALKVPLTWVDGLPALLISRGFKVLTVRKELEHIMQMFMVLHDREALLRREPARRFLAGEGFVAWPGPALRQFVAEIIGHQRLFRGGMVINQRTVSLSDVTVPILYFVGSRDEIARPATVRAISYVAFNAPLHEVEVATGHFGLIVGSKALAQVWPAVARWMHWHESGSSKPFESLESLESHHQSSSQECTHSTSSTRDAVHALALGSWMWSSLGDFSLDVVDRLDAWRLQDSRLMRLCALENSSNSLPFDPGESLRYHAKRAPHSPCLFGAVRVWTYAEVDRRVDSIACQLVRQIAWHTHSRQGARVEVQALYSPKAVMFALAILRLGATPVWTHEAVHDAAHDAAHDDLVTSSKLWMRHDTGDHHKKEQHNTESHRDTRDPDEVAFMLQMKSEGEAYVTREEWAIAALGSAAGARLRCKDTLLPLPSLSGMSTVLVALGGALVAGSSVVLIPNMDQKECILEACRRQGVTVLLGDVSLCQDMCAIPAALWSACALRLVICEGVDHASIKTLNMHLRDADACALARPDGTDAPSILGVLSQALPWRVHDVYAQLTHRWFGF